MRHLCAALLTLALVCVPARGLAIEPGTLTDGTELASATSGLNGEIVRFEGEVISERLRGGEGHVWVNVLSEGSAIGVWAPEELAADLQVLGDWKHTGDLVSVTGVFHEACDVHGGDLDVHASEIVLLERGSTREHSAEWWKLGVALSGVVVGYYGYRRMRRVEEEGPYE